MLVKILGVIDLISGILLFFGAGMKISNFILIIFGIILIIKSSLGMWQDFASWIDLLGGVIFLVMVVISLPWIIILIIGILLLQKGVFSFL